MHIVIIGNGISGISAALHLRKLSDHSITVISAESDHFFTRTELMYVYMGRKRFKEIKPYPDRVWKEQRIELLNGLVIQADLKRKSLTLNDDSTVSFDKLILATGSKPVRTNWPGQDFDGVHSLYSLQDMEAMERHSQNLGRAVIAGGGLIGIEMAEMFRSRRIPVTFLVREESYYNTILPAEESAMVNRLILEQEIDLRLNTELKEIWGDRRSGKVKMAITSKGEKIECGFVGLTAGVRPHIDFLHFTPLEFDRGILVDDFLETNIPGVYAIGGCAQLRNPKPGWKTVESMWHTGQKMGESVAKTISGNATPYEPGIWFNSAKFFGVDYHVIGEVRPGQTSLYWEHPKGRKSIRITCDPAQGHALGFNLMGIRCNQDACEKWIREKTSLENVLPNLQSAGLQPDLSKHYQPALIQQYNALAGKNLAVPSRGGLFSFFK